MQRKADRMAETLIIGGGVYGAAVAWELVSRGTGCRLLEAKHIAAGASGGPGRRGVRANGRDPREIPLMRLAHTLWPSLHEDLDVGPLFERTGNVLLIERAEDLAEAEAMVAVQNRMGIPSELLFGAGVRDCEPHVSDRICGAVLCPGDGAADHTATTKAYAAAAKSGGASIDEGVRAERLIAKDGRAVAIETLEGARIPVEGDVFVLANSGVRRLVADHVDLPVWNQAFQVLLSAPLDDVPIRHQIGHSHRTLALKEEPGNRIMISGGRLGRWDEARQTGEAIAEEVVANVADAVATYPLLEGVEIELADADHLEALSLDGVPIIDRVPGFSNAYMATGWTGHGWAIAPAVAKLMVDWALGGSRPASLAPFAYSRFEG